MKDAQFRYHWWGRGDADASLGIFFDGFSKILTATGVLIAFGIPASMVIGKVLPGIGLAVFVGNIWYFFEAHRLAVKEQRQDVTAQPFGLGASQLSGWLYLIIGPVYWQTKDALLALQVGLAANLRADRNTGRLCRPMDHKACSPAGAYGKYGFFCAGMAFCCWYGYGI